MCKLIYSWIYIVSTRKVLLPKWYSKLILKTKFNILIYRTHIPNLSHKVQIQLWFRYSDQVVFIWHLNNRISYLMNQHIYFVKINQTITKKMSKPNPKKLRLFRYTFFPYVGFLGFEYRNSKVREHYTVGVFSI